MISEHLCVPLGLIISDADREFILPYDDDNKDNDNTMTVAVAVAPETTLDFLYENMCLNKKKKRALRRKTLRNKFNAPRSVSRHTR